MQAVRVKRGDLTITVRVADKVSPEIEFKRYIDETCDDVWTVPLTDDQCGKLALALKYAMREAQYRRYAKREEEMGNTERAKYFRELARRYAGPVR